MKKIIGLLFISSILFSCVRTKEVDINWDEKTLPVVYSFITPDSMVKVLLTESYHGTKVADTFPNTEIYILDKNVVAYSGCFYQQRSKCRFASARRYARTEFIFDE